MPRIYILKLKLEKYKVNIILYMKIFYYYLYYYFILLLFYYFILLIYIINMYIYNLLYIQ